MKKFIRLFICLLLCFSLTAVYVPCVHIEVQASLEDQVDDLENKVSDKKNELTDLKKKYDQLLLEKDTQIELKMNLETQLICLEEESILVKNLIEVFQSMHDVKETRRKALELQRETSYDSFKKTLRYNYMYGQYTNFELLFSAENLFSFLSDDEYSKRIFDYDQTLIDGLVDNANELKKLTEEINLMIQEQENYEKEIADTQNQMKETSLEIDNVILEIENSLNENLTLQDKANEAINAMNDQVKDLLYQIALRDKGEYTGGKMLFPLPLAAYKRMSSKYGYRTHPVTGKKMSFHTGVDFPAASGTKIFAANSGTVILAKYYGGYGNCVMINHGGGIVTLYAHMKSTPPVKVGQKVTIGDVVGYVGTTGSSTGNHLHFEVRVNGQHVDPIEKGYIKLPKK